ncbi:MAG: ABC transporter permease [Candidatus Aminicenantes bacterium]|nr:MAG: ABC transporter permease [Candidatus Aminicenantes bacterium]
MIEKSPKPPRAARFLLRQLKDYNVKYSILTDLDEVYISLYKEGGRFKAACWYWLQCYGTLLKYSAYAITWKTTMLKNHTKIALRNMSRQKIYTFINIAGLAIGISCTSLILLWVQHELSYEDFHEKADNIHLIAWERLANNRHYSSSPAPFAERLRQDFQEFINITRIAPQQEHIVKYGEKVFREKNMMAADSSIFKMFTYPMTKGDPETALTEPNSIVLTESSAKKYFKDNNPLGEVLEVDGRPLQICGVVKDVPGNSELNFDLITRFRDLQIFSQDPRLRWNHFSFYTFVQVKKDVAILSLNQKLSEAMKRYRPWDPYDRYFYLFPLKKIHLYELGGGGLIKYVYIFSLAAIFILVISCINFINLSTARSAKRAREVGIRKVIGADRNLIIKQFFGESFLYVLTAFSLSLLLVQLALPSFNTLVQKSLHFRFTDVPFVFSLIAILLLTVLVSGSYPSIYLSSFQPVRILRTATAVRTKSRFREVLVVVQFAISIMLITCTLVVLRQIHFMKYADLGFDKENLLSVPLTENMSRYAAGIKDTLIQRSKVAKVTAPGSTNQGGRLRWEGMNQELSYLENEVRFRMVDYDFFDTMGAQIVAGRNFSKVHGSDFSGAYVINEEAVKLWQLESPVGKDLDLCGRPGRIIGVVNNIHMGYKNSLRAEVYYLARLAGWDRPRSLILRISPGGIKETVEVVKGIWEEFNGNRPFEFSFFDQEIDKKYRQEEQVSRIFGFFASLSIFISCLGLFGLGSFMAEQKTKEIGIRKVLGASASRITILLNMEFFKCLLVANALAWPVSWYIMRGWLRGYPYRIELGAGFFIISTILAVLITLFTISFQAVRVALGSPSDALRHE